MSSSRVVLVTGANRGIGLETCRQLAKKGDQVILSSRDELKGLEKVEELKEQGLNVDFLKLDVSSSLSIEQAYYHILNKWGRLDVLINNAAVLLEREPLIGSAGDEIKENRKILEKTLNINLVGPYELCERFLPLMAKNKYGRIVNVSSGAGQLSERHHYYLLYSISKTALNGLTCFLADKWIDTNILINAVCPGWVQTEMGGEGATRTVEEGAKGIVWAATLPDEGPTGGFFRDEMAIEW